MTAPLDLATRAELQDLTERRRPSAVAAVLRRMGVRFVVTPSGWPKVSRAQLQRLVDGPARHRHTEPDFDALEELG